MTLAAGKPFGPYVVEMPVGQGGMGAVYRARDAKLGRVVALKVMLESEAADEESRARFVREARLAAQLEHPGIVRVYETGELDGTPYIAMEWIEGSTLKATKIDNGERRLVVLERIAEILAFAHARGVVHRDLKPTNVMIDKNGDAKLVDFGIAKRLAPAVTFATRDGTVLGTPQYMAPEQMLTSAVDARADQYAWGVIAYELLTGERPDRPALAHAALDDRHGPIVMRALAMSPSERFASMDELLAAWRARPVSEVTPARPEPATTERSKGPLFVATAALVMLVGFGALALVMRSRPQPSPPPAPVVPSAAPITSVDAPPPDPTNDVTTTTSSNARPPPKPTASAAASPPPVTRAKRLARVYVQGMSFLDEGEATRAIAAVRPALERCVIDMPMPPSEATFRARVTFYEVTQTPDVEITDRLIIGKINRDVRPTTQRHPPKEVEACVRSTLRTLRLRPTDGQKSAVLYLGLVPE